MRLTALALLLAATLAQGQSVADDHRAGQRFTMHTGPLPNAGYETVVVAEYAPLTCDQQYALTSANLRQIIEAYDEGPYRDMTGLEDRREALHTARRLVGKMNVTKACERTDIDFLVSLDKMLYATHDVTSPDDRRADTAAEQKRTLKQLQDTLGASHVEPR